MFGLFLLLLLTAALALFNPYVYSALPIIQLMILAIYGTVCKNRFNASYHQGDNGEDAIKAADKSAKKTSASWCSAAVILFLITSAASVLVWSLTSGRQSFIDLSSLAPLDLIPDEVLGIGKGDISVIMLGAQILCNLIAAILVFVQRHRMITGSKTKTDEARQAAENVKFRLGWVGAIALALAAVTGMLDMKVGWMSLVLNGAYLLLALIIYLVVSVGKKTENLENKAGDAAEFVMSEITTGGKVNKPLLAALWIITAIVIAVEAIIHFVAVGAGFPLFTSKFGSIFILVSWAFNLILALAFTRSIRRIGKTI